MSIAVPMNSAASLVANEYSTAFFSPVSETPGTARPAGDADASDIGASGDITDFHHVQ
ncbi:MAG: hypothetical protein LKI77_02110 [Bifidobacterium sp.]|nr:hypothetical protein [Bifidobacterium sp.]